ncbi:hypothetical protein [Roseomonas sp. CECT 9278]|uniref:hypothetical protein n=1 Tax=Roseomonas sp. CECT 9278 TaxID=2845823 RepID=UPI001E33E67F|nr:hypothetical protein [Roseomonas sp. CECT 9278]CAH0192023.1 hypothetical protein ROS9278_01708 [Roseomonas sp. CECT 9278]
MPLTRRLTLIAAVVVTIAPTPAVSGSQSSDSSSNCSNGRCTRVDRMMIDDRYGRRGWVREQSWREHEGQTPRWRHGPRLPDWRIPRRGRDDDDD